MDRKQLAGVPVATGAPAPRRTCTLKTRFTTLADVQKSVALLVADDGRLFVPVADARVRLGERLMVRFTTVDGRAGVEREGLVDSTTPDAVISNGQPGVVFRMVPVAPPRASAPVRPLDSEPPSWPAEVPANPLAGLDTNMVALLVECAFTETDQAVSRTYDDIPSFGEAAPPAPRPSEVVHTAVVEPLRLVEAPVIGRARRSPGVIRWLLEAVAVATLAVAALVIVPWRRPPDPAPAPVAVAAAPLPAPVPQPPPAREPAPEPAPAPAPETPPTEAVAVPEPAPASPPGPCHLTLVTRPAQAQVWQESRRLGRTTRQGLTVPCGVTLRLERRHYQALTFETPAEAGGALEVELVRPTATVRITSQPPGAEVRSRGRVLGRTPAVLSLPRYESTPLELRARGFEPWRKRFYIARSRATVAAELVAR